jgi:hypothetical protein
MMDTNPPSSRNGPFGDIGDTIGAAVISHHLRLFGAPATATGAAGVLVLAPPEQGAAATARDFAAGGGIVVAVRPDPAFYQAFEIERQEGAGPLLRYVDLSNEPPRWGRLRSLHPVVVFRHIAASPVVTDASGAAAWLFLPIGAGGILFIGTDLAGDLIRYRQGDPAKEQERPTEPMWGIAGERPNYLFEDQLAGEPPNERHADWWGMALAWTVAAKTGRALTPMLPGGAPGAILLTGDDDQAYLEKDAQQLALLGETPITYFLHPQTRHDRTSLRSMLGKPWIDLGLHPDALEAPGHYGELFREQAQWFRELTGERPFSVRNHGFLNDCYWRHLPFWRDEGVRISSNLPGLDGRMLNGSLLPARLSYDGVLTEHWSLLDAIGDGILFALKMSAAESGDCVRRLGQEVRDSGVPGVVVLNLHPQNFAESREMHLAALELIDSGFYAWNLRQCLDWFDSRDRIGGPGARPAIEASGRPMQRSIWRRLLCR